MIVRNEAVILHSRRYSDTSVILSAYTLDHGRIGFVVKGARRPKSKFGSQVMPLNIVDASYYYKAGRELHTLSGADSVVPLRTLANSYTHLSVGLSICEALLLTQPMGEKNTSLYQLLRSTLIVLDASRTNLYGFFVFFCIHLAEMMGFMIDFSADAESDDSDVLVHEGNVFFSFENGAVLNRVSLPGSQSFRLRHTTLLVLQRVAECSVMHLDEIAMTEQEQREIQHFFVSYFSYHLEKKVVFRVEHLMMGA